MMVKDEWFDSSLFYFHWSVFLGVKMVFVKHRILSTLFLVF